MVLISILLVSFPSALFAQDYPSKPVTVYCAYAAGGTTDITARALAKGAEKLLGVPVMVENKPGNNSTVCAHLIASQKPDGYALAVLPRSVNTRLPQLIKVTYPLDGFTPIMQYSRYIGGLCVLGESPLKTIDEFIAYAKVNPGLSYGSSGIVSQQSRAVEQLAECKGLRFKHVPYKGGAEAVTALMGKQTDFIAGSGAHIPYVQRGIFRMLLVYNAEKRDVIFPDIPIMTDIGCEDYPADYIIISGPKGLPKSIVEKLTEVFAKVAESAEFQSLLKEINLPYDFKSGEQLAKDAPIEYDLYKEYLKRRGIKKE
jgi:tripartite-type tricarboxylate transporter receptor subunit TctC